MTIGVLIWLNLHAVSNVYASHFLRIKMFKGPVDGRVLIAGDGYGFPQPAYARFKINGDEFSEFISSGLLQDASYAGLIILLIFPASHGAFMIGSARYRIRRTARGLCKSCGYDLRGSTDRCPECGETFKS